MAGIMDFFKNMDESVAFILFLILIPVSVGIFLRRSRSSLINCLKHLKNWAQCSGNLYK